MNKDDMILISVDDHIIEPPGMFANHLPEKYRDEAPRLVHNPDGSDTWQFRDTVIPNVALNAVAGRPKEEYGLEPQGLDEIRKGCYDAAERVKDMSAGGVLATMNFPSFPGFAARLFATEDAEFSLALVQAYNDWHIDEWCGSHPGRFIPMAIPAIWDPVLCAAEIRRVADKGVHSLTFTENPSTLGYPSFHDLEYWRPMWQALVDTETVMNVHIGSSGKLAITAPDAPMDVMITLQPMNIVQAAADLLWSAPIKEFPTVKIALSEGGTGWIPYFLERADFSHQHHGAWTHNEVIGTKPSDAFRRHIITCFIDDKFGLKNLADVGEDMVTWECDYPHSDCTWPNSPEVLWEGVKDLPAATINKITHLNAMREFSFDPFAVLGKANCHVGAVRALAGHVSTQPTVGLGGARPLDGEKRSVTSGDLMRMFAA